MKEIKNCPNNWFITCRNSNLYCHKCGAANDSNERVYYSPTTEGKSQGLLLTKHPAILKQRKEKNDTKPIKNKEKSQQVKKGLKQEYKLRDSINAAVTSSLKSGSILGDGDLKALDGFIKIDSKLRIKKQSFSVSWNEYEKGLAQGINTWAITINKDHSDHTLICMTEALFSQLIATIKDYK